MCVIIGSDITMRNMQTRSIVSRPQFVLFVVAALCLKHALCDGNHAADIVVAEAEQRNNLGNHKIQLQRRAMMSIKDSNAGSSRNSYQLTASIDPKTISSRNESHSRVAHIGVWHMGHTKPSHLVHLLRSNSGNFLHKNRTVEAHSDELVDSNQKDELPFADDSKHTSVQKLDGSPTLGDLTSETGEDRNIFAPEQPYDHFVPTKWKQYTTEFTNSRQVALYSRDLSPVSGLASSTPPRASTVSNSQYSIPRSLREGTIHMPEWHLGETLLAPSIDHNPVMPRSSHRTSNQGSLSRIKRRRKRDTKPDVSSVTPPSLDVTPALASHRLQNTTTKTGVKPDFIDAGRDSVASEDKWPGTNLTYRSRGLVGLVDDYRLPRVQSGRDKVKEPSLGPLTRKPATLSPSTEAASTVSLFSPGDTTEVYADVIDSHSPEQNLPVLNETSVDVAQPEGDTATPADDDFIDESDKKVEPEPSEEQFPEVGSDVEHVPVSEVDPLGEESDGIKDDDIIGSVTGADNNGSQAEGHVGVKPDDLTPDSEMEYDTESEIIVVGDSHGGCEDGVCYAEPTPEWPEAKITYKAAWEVHVYGCGIIFGVLALNSLASIVRLWKEKNLLSQGYFISLNIMLLSLCTTRACYLLIDGYNSQNTLHPATAYFLSSIGFPSITSAFSILFLALLKTTRMQLLSPNIQKPQVLFAIIFCHVALCVTTDLVVGFLYTKRVLVFVCHVVSVTWGLFLFLAYIYIFRQLHVAARRRQKEMARLGTSMNKIKTEHGPKNPPKLMLILAIQVTFITALLGFFGAAIHVYGMIAVVNVFTNKIPEPWPWWGMNFGLRLTEIAMCVTMGYVATQPLRYRHGPPLKSQGSEDRIDACWENIYIFPCHRFCTLGTPEPDESFHQLALSGPSCSQQQPERDLGYANENLEADTAETAYQVTQTPELGHKLDETTTGPFHREVTYLRERSNESENADKRPRSMLVNESGFYRFRHEGDPEGDPLASSSDDVLEGSRGGSVSVDCVLSGKGGPSLNRSTASNVVQHGRLPASCKYSVSVPNTGTTTPVTPRSYCSTDLEAMSGVFTFRPPSSIHLRDSIEGALDYVNFTLKSPDYFGTPDSGSLPKTPEDLDEDLRLYHNCKFSDADLPIEYTPGREQLADSPDVFVPCLNESPELTSSHNKHRHSLSSSSPDLTQITLYAPRSHTGKLPANDASHYILMHHSIYRSNSDSLNSIKYDQGVEV